MGVRLIQVILEPGHSGLQTSFVASAFGIPAYG